MRAAHRRAATAEDSNCRRCCRRARASLRACEEVLSVRSVPGACCDDLRLGTVCADLRRTHHRPLSGAPVMLREGEGGAPFTLIGAAHVDLHSVDDALCMLRAGELHKRVAATAMNDASSRAHTIFLLSLTQARADDAVTSSLALVDLAGSEQLKQSRAVGQQRNEAVAINSSLLVLGKVIHALSRASATSPTTSVSSPSCCAAPSAAPLGRRRSSRVRRTTPTPTTRCRVFASASGAPP